METSPLTSMRPHLIVRLIGHASHTYFSWQLFDPMMPWILRICTIGSVNISRKATG